jgi:hypothetical protein
MSSRVAPTFQTLAPARRVLMGDVLKPGPISNLAVTLLAGPLARLTWTAPTPGADEIRVYRQETRP